jgi:hypothetical protein
MYVLCMYVIIALHNYHNYIPQHNCFGSSKILAQIEHSRVSLISLVILTNSVRVRVTLHSILF